MRKFWITDATPAGDVTFNKIISAPTAAEAQSRAKWLVSMIDGYSGMQTFECTEEETPELIKPVNMVCRDTGCSTYIINGRWYAGNFDAEGNFVTEDGKHKARKEDNVGHPQFAK